MPRVTPQPAGAPQRASLAIWIAGLLLGAAYLALAAVHVSCGLMNADEGFYALAARAVWQGELPYRDFGYTQMPLLPYVNGAVMSLTRFGLFEQRAINGLWAALAVLLGVRLLVRRGLAGRAVFLVGLFALTPSWQYYIHLGKTYGLVSLVAMAAVTVLLEWGPGTRKSIVLAALCVVGVGCRLPAAPFFGLLWLASLRDREGFVARQAGIAGITLAASAALLLLPFFLAAPAQARFWVVDFFRISVPLRDFRVSGREMLALAPALWALVAAVGLHGLLRRRSWSWSESAVAVAALAALGFNLLPRGAYDEYGVPFLLPLAVSILLLAPELPWPALGRNSLAVAALIFQLAIIPALYAPFQKAEVKQSWSRWLPLSGAPYDVHLRAEIREARRTLAGALPPGAEFQGSAVILAVEANRPVPRRLRMGAFAVTSDYPPVEADRLHLMTFDELAEIYRAPETRVLGLHSVNLFNYSWSVPSFRSQTPQERGAWAARFSNLYQPVYRDPEFQILVRR